MSITDLIPGVSQAKLILGGAMSLALIGFALWVVRVNHLRAEYKGYNDDAVAALVSAGFVKPTASHIALDINALTKVRDTDLGSLNECLAVNADDAKQSDALAKSYTDSKTIDTANNAANDKREAGTAPARAALQAISKLPAGSVPCKVPAAVAANLAGL